MGVLGGMKKNNKTASAGRKWVTFQRWLLLEVIGKMPIGGAKKRQTLEKGRKNQKSREPAERPVSAKDMK